MEARRHEPRGLGGGGWVLIIFGVLVVLFGIAKGVMDMREVNRNYPFVQERP